jgi:ATP-dependent Clp protease ATP-binding subunit ClpA
VIIELSEEAGDWLARKGYDHQMGARPLARIIQEHVKKPLADEVLFGRLVSGGTVKVLFEATPDGEGKLAFTYIDRDREKALPRPPDRKALPRPKSSRPKGGNSGGSKSNPQSVH